eukprot:TRINITY_DN9993_c0_g1_i1.p1 TRINITY_DN9993_c0_g1~~TRINITY_DN9993_c0_g1_i1.p1  ORF type:complete len:187 (-),score=53.29 TRINITY_DN9993_c0_g1_i1:215-775(-)
MDDKHEKFMRIALDVAKDAIWKGEVPVGCVFVHNDEIISKTHNMTNQSQNGTRHAEIESIDTILYGCSQRPREHHLLTQDCNVDPSYFHEIDVYVTLEPCIMCAAALRKLNVRHVYFGASNEKFGGTVGLFNILSDTNIEGDPIPFTGGILEDEAIDILKCFFEKGNPNAPSDKRQRPLKHSPLLE